MRTIFSSLLICCALMACDRQNSATLKSANTSAASQFAFDDETRGIRNDGSESSHSLLDVKSQLASTSSDGREAELLLDYRVDPYVAAALKPGSFVQFEYVPKDGQSWVVGQSPINDDLAGSVEVTVPTNGEGAKLIASINGLQSGVIEDQQTLVTQMPAIVKRDTTDLSRVNDLRAELVDGSYESELVGDRRVHRFAIRVTDPTAGPINELLSDADKEKGLEYSITGLDADPSAHFVALENGYQDVESPVTVGFEEFPLAVYLVIDTSKSIVDSRQVHHLKNAVTSSVLALSSNAQFDYRTFNGQVNRINGLRELDFDSGESSATAAYYALDTALSDIENFGSLNQDKVVMLFTDGKDRASRNHYNDDFIDNDQVHEYIVQRVDQVKRTQQNSLGRQLDVYTIGFYDQENGIDMATEVQKLDKIAQAGGTNASFNNFNVTDIDDAFATVVHNVRGVYYLQYSSQQMSSNNKLELLVKVNGQESRLQLPTDYRTP